MKKDYIIPDMEITEFETEDVITGSIQYDSYELEGTNI